MGLVPVMSFLYVLQLPEEPWRYCTSYLSAPVSAVQLTDTLFSPDEDALRPPGAGGLARVTMPTVLAVVAASAPHAALYVVPSP